MAMDSARCEPSSNSSTGIVPIGFMADISALVLALDHVDVDGGIEMPFSARKSRPCGLRPFLEIVELHAFPLIGPENDDSAACKAENRGQVKAPGATRRRDGHRHERSMPPSAACSDRFPAARTVVHGIAAGRSNFRKSACRAADVPAPNDQRVERVEERIFAAPRSALC